MRIVRLYRHRFFGTWDHAGALAVCCFLTACPLSDDYFVDTGEAALGIEAGADGGTGGMMHPPEPDGPKDPPRMDASKPDARPAPAMELARSKSVTASTEQTSKGNLAPLGNDGNATTRWSASEALIPSWWRVDLGAMHAISRIEIDWEFARAYGYLIEVSSDDLTYVTLVDRSASTDATANQTADVTTSGRYVRITVTAVTATPISWPSFWEVRVFGL